MKISIHSFSITIITGTVMFFTTLFSIHYFQIREQTAKMMVDTLTLEISETAYLISRNVISNTIVGNRSLLERRVALNKYVHSATLYGDNAIIISTGPEILCDSKSTIVNIRDIDGSPYDFITNPGSISTEVVYFENEKRKTLTLVYKLHSAHIHEAFDNNNKEFTYLFALIPLGVIAIIVLLLRQYVTQPMTVLRKYAYSQTSVPLEFPIKELDYIRTTMIDTFTRLDNERKELYDMARTDSLSGISNRYHLEEKIIEIIEQASRRSEEFALVFLDLDNFKSVNDSLGHDVGDILLKTIADLLKKSVRANDIVTRIGGDEFILVINDYDSDMHLIEIIDRIQYNVRNTMNVAASESNVTASIGIAMFPKDGEDLFTLMKHADIALYNSKDNGKNKYSFYTDIMNNKIQKIIAMNNDMRTALVLNRYTLHYQPQVEIMTGKIVGCEALIRWIDPIKGFISPDEFISVAEQNGFIVDLGSWIMSTAFAQQYEWERQGININMSVNFSARQILTEGFLESLDIVLTKYPINPNNISIEITEYVFLNKLDRVHVVFDTLKKMGFKISLDDFGTGYSSLSYLKQFPIDIIKIDKSFIDDYNTVDGQIFLETIIKMAQTLGKSLVAEGVETDDQLKFLQTFQCCLYQGWLCSKAVPPEDFVLLLG